MYKMFNFHSYKLFTEINPLLLSGPYKSLGTDNFGIFEDLNLEIKIMKMYAEIKKIHLE